MVVDSESYHQQSLQQQQAAIQLDSHQPSQQQHYSINQPMIQVQQQQSARNRRNSQQFNLHQQALNQQPSVQINIQSLIKPMQEHFDKQQQPIDPAPIVYSFGQTDFSTTNSNNNNNKATTYLSNNKVLTRTLLPQHKKITWGMGDISSFDEYQEDDFADILGKIKLPPAGVGGGGAVMMADQSKENKPNNNNNIGQYNLQDILEPLAKASAGTTARSQYLSVSRYVAGQPSTTGIIHRDSNTLSLMSNLFPTGAANRKNSGVFMGKATSTNNKAVELPPIWTEPPIAGYAISTAAKHHIRGNQGSGIMDWTAK